MRILLVVSRAPWPPRRGDQLRTLQTLESLAADHRVTLLAPEPAPVQAGQATGAPRAPELPPGCELVTYRPPGLVRRGLGIARAAWSGLPFQSGWYDSRDLRRRVRGLLGGVDLVIVQLARLAFLGGELAKVRDRVSIVVDLVDSLSLNLTRRAVLDRRWFLPLFSSEIRRLERAERRLFESAQGTVLVSPRDRDWLLRRWKLESDQARRLAVVPLEVESEDPDLRSQTGAGAPAGKGDPQRPVLALTGNLGYFVNSDALLWWLADVWPALSRERPELRLMVAGARPPRRLRQAVADSGAELIDSPPDLRTILASATVALAPLRAGSGVPVKVLEAWAVGVPVVASHWAAAGTGARAGEELLIADSPEEWISSILSLVDDPERRRDLSEAGRRRLVLDHSATRVREAWRTVVEAASRST